MWLLHLIFLFAVAAEIPIPASLGQRIIHMELDRGLALANVAATEQSVFCLQAEKIYAGVKALLPKISGMDEHGRAELEARVRDLGMALDLIRTGSGGEDPPFPHSM
jgi:hypothetical protein